MSIKPFLKAFLLTIIIILFHTSCRQPDGSNEKFLLYKQQLSEFREEFSVRDMPEVRFFLFGMGNRPKLLYKDGLLMNAATGEVLRKWEVKEDLIIPNEYRVDMLNRSSGETEIYENETGVYIRENGIASQIEGTDSYVRLPDFKGHRYSEILKVLHQEILINVIDSRPVPNFLVYQNPWRRDAAMMAMCLEKTGNIGLIREWVLHLDDPYDHNNKSDGIPENEADNLGQTLYLLSRFTDQNDSLVTRIREELPLLEKNDEHGKYISGRSDFQSLPVYQTKWLKLGLRAMKMEDNYQVPLIPDSYSSLFWMDFKDQHIPGNEEWRSDNYPYIGWARDHFYGTKQSPISDEDYPLTWETEASQAYYEGMSRIDTIYTRLKTCVPHTWHAAEIFLYLSDQ